MVLKALTPKRIYFVCHTCALNWLGFDSNS